MTKTEMILSTDTPMVLNQRSQSSVEIKRNSKGDVEFIVKVYNDDSIKAGKTATKLFNALNKEYPRD